MTHAVSRLPHSHSTNIRQIWSFDDRQGELVEFNRHRLIAGPQAADWRDALDHEHRMRRLEGEFIELERRRIRHLVANVPTDAPGFLDWFADLRETGPGQGHFLFPWLATVASAQQMAWFLSQEVAGEAGFEDLVAMSQVKLPNRPKLEMARNYWDEMGRGNEKGMHGPMLSRLARYFHIVPADIDVVPESLALGNLMIGLAANRRYAFEAIGALGAIELTAPTRAVFVERGLRRLGAPAAARQYFAVHAILDVEHSQAWNWEVLGPLVEEDPRRARSIAEGAMMRLSAGQRCFQRYQSHFNLTRS